MYDGDVWRPGAMQTEIQKTNKHSHVAGQDVEQRRLAGTGRTHDGGQFAGPKAAGQVVEYHCHVGWSRTGGWEERGRWGQRKTNG